MLLDVRVTLTPADQSTHRRFPFDVPADCTALDILVRYAPKHLPLEESRRLAQASLVEHTTRLAAVLGNADLAARWSAEHAEFVRTARISNLVTITLDDALNVYRGAAHRHAEDQHLALTLDSASPGLIPGPLPAGEWTLTLSGHTLVSAQCVVEIQIGAETASSRPRSS
jgi:hypothetical protein